MRIPDNVQRGLRKFAVSNLMNYIVAGMAIVYVLDLVLPINLYGMLALIRDGVLAGQIWRLLTFVILPPQLSLLWIIFSLYFYWMIGTTLENQWGTFKFNLYYWVGILGNIIACMITGYANNMFLNLSLFFAFAALNPNYEVLVFFILPVKMKYLAILNAALYLYMFITGSAADRWMIVFSLLNVILFLGGDLLGTLRREKQYWKTRYNFRKSMKNR